MTIEIKDWRYGSTIYTADVATVREAVEQAVREGQSLDFASLDGASLDGASLVNASLVNASLDGARLVNARLGDLLANVPLIENIDAAILAAVEENGNSLEMSDWHTCETTHCRAGWAIHLAGERGYALEGRFGPAMAGTLLYLKAGATRIPNWIASNDDALADMRARAAA